MNHKKIFLWTLTPMLALSFLSFSTHTLADEEVEEEVALTEEVDSDSTDEEIEKIANETIGDIDDSDEDRAKEILFEIERGIDNEIKREGREMRRRPNQIQNIKERTENLEKLKRKIRTKAIHLNKNIIKKGISEKNPQGLYEIRWGSLKNHRGKCTGVIQGQLEKSLENDEIPKECLSDEKKVEYKGEVKVNSGEIKLKKTLLFEKNDSVKQVDEQTIHFVSNINGHWDGLLIGYKPAEKKEPLKIDIKIGDYSESFSSDQLFGKKGIGNLHSLEIKPLSRALPGIKNDIHSKLIEEKVKIKGKIEKVQNKIQKLQLMGKLDKADDLDELLEEVEEYNFDDITGEEIGAEMDLLVADLSDADDRRVKNRSRQLKKKIKALKDKARGRKYQKNIIPFKDTDDTDWYTEFAAKAKAKGIFSGYKDAEGNELGEFRPGNNITVAEIIKVGLETAKKGKSKKGSNPKIKAAANHWAKQYVKQAEDLNLDLTKNEDIDLNRPATRGEVVRMILEALDIKPSRINKTDFSDVKKSHPQAEFIQYAKELGIVSGDSGKTTFRPDEPINRAEASKITSQVIENLLGGQEGEE